MLTKSALVLMSFFLAAPALAQMPYLEEMKALGSVSGQGLVCGASKYDQFEMLARALILTKAPNNDMLQKGAYAYSEAKASVYMNKQLDGGYLCGEIASRFDNQEIFQISLYEDGTIKMPDGAVITPKMPYDAKQIYRKNDKLKGNLKAIYNGATNKGQARILKQGGKISTTAEEYNKKTAATTQPAAAYRPQQLQPAAPTSVPVRNVARSSQRATISRAQPVQDSSIGHISRR